MRYAIIVLLLCSILMLGGCGAVLGVTSTAINGSGKMVTQEYDFTGFDMIDAGSNFHVTVGRGNSFAVKVTADDNVMEHLKVTSGGGKLTLGIKPGSWSLNDVTMKAEVTLPALKTVIGRDNAAVQFGQFQTGDFKLDLSGNAVAQGQLQARKVDITADGNSQAMLAGTTDNLDARGKGNVILTLDQLAAKQVSVDMNNNAMATVQAEQALDYTLNGNAGLTYLGDAKLGRQQARANSWARSGE